MNYGRAEVLTVDDGVRPGCLLLAYYNTGNAPEAALLRVVEPTLWPGYVDMSGYVEAGETRARAYACNIFGCFYRDGAGSAHFESYLEGFYDAARSCTVIRPSAQVTQAIACYLRNVTQ